ncbi:ABC transporter transmembrane domain-containing protein [Stakelama saccharophila]|uniref:ABC transporter transmembrane domain-containing protein n=1 Tax=Stakelama saccharophila TaxID=3075605 RepID=A0ABZ0B7P3_9SPHN|nr:ABC transporter transmembrane domain-containing protein [Stakelama sp. W311]WNO53310.1 ABC transporter transmembrane domain-containing protein [Stakelama sp. W311]
MADTPPTPTPPAPATARPEQRKLSNLLIVWRHTAKYKLQIACALVALTVAAVATLWIPHTFQQVIDHGFATGAGTETIAPYFEEMLLVIIVLALSSSARFYFVSWLGERTVADMRIAVQRNLLRLTPRWFEENRPSEIASRLTADTAVVEVVVGTTLSVALRNLVLAVGGIAYLFTLAPRLALWLIIGIPAVLLPIILLGRRVRQYSRSSQDRIADIGAIAVETLGAMKIVQAFGQERREGERFETAVGEGFATAKRRIGIRAVLTAFVITLVFGAVTLILWDAVHAVASGELSGGSLTAFVFTAVIVTGAFQALSDVLGELLRGSGAAARLSELLAAEPEITAPADPVALPAPVLGAITFDHVTFHYPSRPDLAALHDFSLEVTPGETVAVVGPSGAGKSTLFALIERFYDTSSGEVRVDGVPVHRADPAALRAQIAMVPQETVIFGASARDNLRYGRWEASDAELWRAAEAANAASFLRALPDGLDTFLGEGGARLSGGQRQRIAIARALLRDAPILLLDEATSALDAESERLVQEALEGLMANRTTLVIAHRLATVRAAQRIVVMDEGRIVETGSHADLIRRDGLYARLASLQFSQAA